MYQCAQVYPPPLLPVLFAPLHHKAPGLEVVGVVPPHTLGNLVVAETTKLPPVCIVGWKRIVESDDVQLARSPILISSHFLNLTVKTYFRKKLFIHSAHYLFNPHHPQLQPSSAVHSWTCMLQSCLHINASDSVQLLLLFIFMKIKRSPTPHPSPSVQNYGLQV